MALDSRLSTLASTPQPLSLVFALWTLAGCSLLQSSPKITEHIDLFAVLPIERVEPSEAPPGDRPGRLAPGAQNVVTAQIYDVLSSSPEWRFVPDLTVEQALTRISPHQDLESRALALGKAVGAEGVLYGTVSRYVERVGGDYGARQPASVSFSLQLISVSSGKIVWKGAFDETQEPLSMNLLNWWQFWQGGPRWFSAPQFTRLGVQRLLGNLSKSLGN
jgi:hypothetical protein